MSALAIAIEPTLFDQMGGELTLDDLIVGAWEGLTAHAVVGCPVCGGEMAPEYGSHAQPVASRCHDCGSSLS
jgi:hypothetical protein